MGRYKYIKTSYTNWIQEIPAHWSEKAIKRNASLIYGDNLPQEARIEGVFNVYGSNGVVGNHEDYNTKGETIIIGRKGSAGALNYNSTNSFVIDTAFFIDKNSSNCNLKWLYYVLTQLELTRLEKESPVPGLGREQVLYRYIAFPPPHEQKAIADYLDKACQRIDEIIEIKERQLESIKAYLTTKITEWVTKGIENTAIETTDCLWIPEVKKGWAIKPLKRMLAQRLKYGANESAEDENIDDPRYIRITDFDDNGNLRDDTFKSLSLEVAKPYMLSEGDVLFARSGATVGKTFIFKDYKGKACFAGYLIKADCDRSKLLPEYLYYFTKSKAYEEWKNLIFTQATIQNIGADKYQYLLMPHPEISEQVKIVELIESLWRKTENLKTNIKAQITILQSYRKSLIHECVTGKKQVWEGEIKE